MKKDYAFCKVLDIKLKNLKEKSPGTILKAEERLKQIENPGGTEEKKELFGPRITLHTSIFPCCKN